MDAHEHVGSAEIAALLNVSKQRIHQLRATYPDFPLPVARLSGTRYGIEVWHAEDVHAWVARHPDRKSGVRAARSFD